MLISDILYISYTEEKDYPLFRSFVKHLGISPLGLTLSESERTYIKISPIYKRKIVQYYSPLNINRKYDFTVSIVSRKFMKQILSKKGVKRLPTRYNYSALFKTESPYKLFKELFGIKREEASVDRNGNKEWTIKCHKEGVSYYLMINNKFLYAVEVRGELKIEHPIRQDWKDEFAKYLYICSSI